VRVIVIELSDHLCFGFAEQVAMICGFVALRVCDLSFRFTYTVSMRVYYIGNYELFNVVFCTTDDDVKLEDGERVYDDEKEGVAYNYSFFHLMFCLASLYIMMTLTHWYK